jgi:hypothetical protein
MLIGLPVAFTPGFGPHEDVSVEAEAAAVLVPPLDEVPVAAGAAALLELLLLLLPHPARTTSERTASRAIPTRIRDVTLMVFTNPLLSSNM